MSDEEVQSTGRFEHHVSDSRLDAGVLPNRGRPLRVAVVGGGKMGQHHMRAIKRLGDVARLTGVVDPDPDARDVLLKVGIDAPVFSDMEALLRVGPVDVMHVCTPPDTHLRLALRALDAGCHTYVEKPVAQSVREAGELLALACSKGLRVCPGHQLLYELPAQRARTLLPALGEVIHIESYFSFRTVRRMPGGQVPLRADLQLLDILPHPVYLLLEFLREAGPEGATVLETVQVGPRGTVHAVVRRGRVTGTLVVTLDGRPIESYLRVVGTNGSLHADFVRGTVQRLLGPGSSGIDKALNPYRLARQLVAGTTSALMGRMLKRQRSYPGLAELFRAFYESICAGAPTPVSEDGVLETVLICEKIGEALVGARESGRASDAARDTERILVTGGSGFLGTEVVRALTDHGYPVRCLARRTPPGWECLPGVEYVRGDLSKPLHAEHLRGVTTVIHCAAETVGGWEEHRRNSVGAVENVVQAAAAAGVPRIIHISSLAVLAEPRRGRMVNEASPVHSDSKRSGAYVWGKLESELLLQRRAAELGLEIRIVRPGAILDGRHFEPPGRLGKRLGNVFVAVGGKDETLGVVDVRFAANLIAAVASRFDEAPPVLHLLDPRLPRRRELVAQLRRSNPDLTVLWLPRVLLRPLSSVAVTLQKLMRPGRSAIDLAKVFAGQHYDTSLVADVATKLTAERTVHLTGADREH